MLFLNPLTFQRLILYPAMCLKNSGEKDFGSKKFQEAISEVMCIYKSCENEKGEGWEKNRDTNSCGAKTT
jgi:hypothetical protein